MPNCKICADILSCLTDSNAKHEINLGSYDEALSSQCSQHTPLIRAFIDYCRISSGKSHRPEPDDIGFSGDTQGCRLTLTESISKLGFFWSLLLKHRPDVPNHTGLGRILDPNWVDLDFVHKAKRKCLREHGPKCQNPMKIPHTSPAWLIDVQHGCIVPGEGRGSYVALSYRWGHASGFSLDEGTLQRLQQQNSLNHPEVSNRLPPMLKHAMSLVPAMCERYLWIDRLCIVHGNYASTAEQLNLMSAIYARAIVTIIVADGDSCDGLLGLKDISSSRDLQQRVFPFGDEKLIVRNTGIFSMMSGTEYYKRAWTYQEFTMSPRRLLFNRKEVHWQCQCSVWHEELTFGAEVDKYIDSRPTVMLAGFPDLDSFGHMVTNYNERGLTYDEDALSGIAGLLSVLSRSFTGGFLYGCPEMFFDRALGWQPQWSFTNLRRRVPSDRPPADRVASTALPSWSWIGWSGMVSLRYGEAARLNDRQHWMEETIPITEWYTSSAPSGQPQRKIESAWFRDREVYKEWARDLTRSLPDGWTRNEAGYNGRFREEPRLYPDGCGGQLFEHCDMPDTDCQEWYYPFPVAKITESTPFFTPEQTQYLFCETKKTRLWTERADYEEHPGGSHMLKFRDQKSGSVVGRLHLQNDEQLNTWPEVLEQSEDVEGKNIEVVAIYETIKYLKTFNEKLRRYDYPLSREERIAVLWVEWDGEVAYRLACGYVDKGAWERLRLEDIDLVLG